MKQTHLHWHDGVLGERQHAGNDLALLELVVVALDHLGDGETGDGLLLDVTRDVALKGRPLHAVAHVGVETQHQRLDDYALGRWRELQGLVLQGHVDVLLDHPLGDALEDERLVADGRHVCCVLGISCCGVVVFAVSWIFADESLKSEDVQSLPRAPLKTQNHNRLTVPSTCMPRSGSPSPWSGAARGYLTASHSLLQHLRQSHRRQRTRLAGFEWASCGSPGELGVGLTVAGTHSWPDSSSPTLRCHMARSVVTNSEGDQSELQR